LRDPQNGFIKFPEENIFGYDLPLKDRIS